jgi:multiple sugar transport system ATP-binding protein
MRAYISMLHQQLGTTTLYVTHDQTEAMTMGDRVAVMRNGILEQVASPQELYRAPRNLFVASFIGSPAMNLVLVRLERDNDELFVRLSEARLAVRRPALADRVGEEVVLGIRPEDFEDATLAHGADAYLDVTIALAEPLGSEVVAHFRVDVGSIVGRKTIAEAHEGTEGVLDGAADGTRLTARLGARSTAETGGQMRLAIDTSRLHFFDPVTEQAIG